MNRVQLTLLAAKTLISHKRDWIKFDTALTKTEQETKPDATDAHMWDAVGAIRATGAKKEVRKLAEKKLNAVAKTMPQFHAQNTWDKRNSAASFNDNYVTTHKDVMKLFNKAIEYAA